MPEESKPARTNYGLEGNSNKKREAGTPKERPKIEKMIEGEAIQRKKPLGTRIKETFTGDDSRTVGHYILFDVILPAAKDMISEAVSKGIERLLFGENARGSSHSRSRPGYTAYNRVSTTTRAEPREISQRGRAVHDFREVILATRGEAEAVIDQLVELIKNYEVANVNDFYDMVGITGSFTDDKWGWYDLRGARAERVREGYLVSLPKPEPLD